MQKTCRQCATKFEITDEDLKFYDKISPVFAGKKYQIPPPTLCPDCRQQRRLAFRNERKLYHRKCDFSQKEIISNLSPDKPFKVYEKEIWWSDQWDPLQYAQDFDFSRPFFEQWRELQLKVPKINLFSKGGENVAYTNHATYNKDCYMLFNATQCNNVHYTTNYVIKCNNCIDCYSIENCELLYNSFLCENCYGSKDLVYSKNCSNSNFLYDCRSCNDCTMSYGLRNKKYCYQNKQYTKEDYEAIIKKLDLGNYGNYKTAQDEFKEMIKYKAIHRYAIIDQSENCTGDYVIQSKDTFDSYYAIKCRDSRYLYDSYGHNTSYDSYESALECELQYECYACNFGKNMKFCHVSQESHDMYYTDYCFNSHDLFGCIGLKRKSYCILNKQYSKEEYEKLAPQIIEHMQRHGEWGENFPMKYAPFAYNESVANEFYTLTEQQVKEQGLNWERSDTLNRYQGEKINIPGNIKNVDDDILKSILACDHCGKNYKLIHQELKFYRELKVPIPRFCFECRHQKRLEYRNPRKLWQRNCTKCGTTIQTSYSPDRPEMVYCDGCYLKEVY